MQAVTNTEVSIRTTRAVAGRTHHTLMESTPPRTGSHSSCCIVLGFTVIGVNPAQQAVEATSLSKMPLARCISPDVADDLLHVVLRDSGDRRHITELPVVLPDPLPNRNANADVGVVAWLVDSVN